MSNYKGVATKVKPEVKRSIGRLCKARGITEYEMLQMMCDCIVRYMDDMHNLSPELERAMAIFEHMKGWSKAYNLADPTCGKEVAEAVYLTHDPTGRKKGLRASLVRHVGGKWEHTDNVTIIHDRMLETLLPEVHHKMLTLAVETGCSSLLELQHKMIEQYETDTINAGYRKEFEDVRTNNGKPIVYGNRAKKVRRVTPDEIEEDAGFRPHGGEW